MQPAALLMVVLPLVASGCSREAKTSCVANLKMIAGAKAMWGLDTGKTNAETPTKQELLVYLRKWPQCPAGGTYLIENVRRSPHCSFHTNYDNLMQ